MKLIHEIVYECQNCGEEFFYSDSDTALSHPDTSYKTDFDKCPKCGSLRITKEEDDFYVDENSNYIADYNPNIAVNLSCSDRKPRIGFKEIFYGIRLVLFLIPCLLLICAIYKMLQTVFTSL